MKSHLTRGAWIEIETWIDLEAQYRSRTSHEVRGLKYVIIVNNPFDRRSHLTRGAWIEMLQKRFPATRVLKSHLTRGAWIEISQEQACRNLQECRTSHEVRGLKL